MVVLNWYFGNLDVFTRLYWSVYTLKIISQFEVWGGKVTKFDRASMTLGLVDDDSVISKLLKARYDSSTVRNPYINWCRETTVCPSMALHVIFGQILPDIDIGSKSHFYMNNA